MIISCGFIFLLAVLIEKVNLQDTVEGYFGGSVVLPCSSAEPDLKLQDTNVHWRDKADKIVYSIIKGKDSVSGQEHGYKNRVETFPDEYLRRNFSIHLNNLTYTDAGKYSCYITPSHEQKTIQLNVKESASAGHKPSDQEHHTVHSGSKSVSTLGSLLWVCIVALVVL